MGPGHEGADSRAALSLNLPTKNTKTRTFEAFIIRPALPGGLIAADRHSIGNDDLPQMYRPIQNGNFSRCV